MKHARNTVVGMRVTSTAYRVASRQTACQVSELIVRVDFRQLLAELLLRLLVKLLVGDSIEMELMQLMELMLMELMELMMEVSDCSDSRSAWK